MPCGNPYQEVHVIRNDGRVQNCPFHKKLAWDPPHCVYMCACATDVRCDTFSVRMLTQSAAARGDTGGWRLSDIKGYYKR